MIIIPPTLKNHEASLKRQRLCAIQKQALHCCNLEDLNLSHLGKYVKKQGNYY